jgi:cation transport ATPase
MSQFQQTQDATQEGWLQTYYFVRAGFSFAWVAAALLLGQYQAWVGACLLVAYPAWDALANYIDGARSGGLRANRTQAINVGVSLATAAAVAFSLSSMHRVLGVFGAWAILSGLLQLGTAMRRWKRHGAQWAMILSGAQSALAGAFFILQARMPATPSIANVAGYAGVGAFYFLLSAVWLTVGLRRRRLA